MGAVVLTWSCYPDGKCGDDWWQLKSGLWVVVEGPELLATSESPDGEIIVPAEVYVVDDLMTFVYADDDGTQYQVIYRIGANSDTASE